MQKIFHIRLSILHKPDKYRKIFLFVLAISIIAPLIWLPRRMDLNRAVTTDEIKWLERSLKFLIFAKQGDYQRTFRAPHPGVTVMWLGSGGLLHEYQSQTDRIEKLGDKLETREFYQGIIDNPLENLVSARIFMSYAHLVVLLLAFWLSWRLIGWLPSLLAFLLVAFDPFHLALSRILHLDALLADLYLLAVLAVISFLFQRRFYDLLIASFAAGLCWLTKSPGFFLLPTAALLFLIDFWSASRQQTAAPPPKMLWDYTWRFALWVLIAASVFVLLWPAMWVNPLGVLLEILASASGYAAEGHSSPIFFNGQIFPTGISGPRFFYFYPLTYLWRTTPVSLLGLLAAAWAFFSKQNLFSKPGVRRTFFSLLITVLVFCLAMNLGSKKFDRYLLPVYAPLNIIAALGWTALALWLKQRLPALFARIVPAALLMLLIVFQVWSSLSIFPYSLAYYNPLLGGGRKAPQVMQIGWGEGLDQAAMYLNQKDQAKKLNVFSWYENGPFSFFFEGNSQHIGTGAFTSEDWKTLEESDYLVIYIHQWQRNLPAELLDYIKSWNPEHSVWINNIEYARIYKLDK